MLDRIRIAALIPHRGAMCLLEQVVAWDAEMILCRSTTHLDPANPLRRAGGLGGIAGIEYGMQAAALHGALAGGEPQPPGYLAALHEARVAARQLDRVEYGVLAVTARLVLRQDRWLIHAFAVAAEDGRVLVEGRASIVLGSGD